MAVTRLELDGSGKLSLDGGGPVGERLFECDWADAVALAQKLRGIAGAFSGSRPEAFPWMPTLFCTGVHIEGCGQTLGTSELIAYSRARLTARYEPVEMDERAERLLVRERIVPSVEFVTMPAQKLFWDNVQKEPVAPEEAPGKLIRSLDWIYEIREMETLPAALLSLIGHVNQEAMRSPTLGWTFAAETLLFHLREPEREITTEGVQAWTVTYVFSYRPGGWNKFDRPGYDTPQTMFDDDGDELKIYPLADFNQIIL